MKSPTRRDLLGVFTLKLVLFLVMVELGSAFAPSSHTSLVPSQVAQPHRSKNGSKVSRKKHRAHVGFLVPSQVLKSQADPTSPSATEVADSPTGPLLTNRQKRRSRGKKPQATNNTETGNFESTTTLSKAKATKQKNKRKGLTGDFPDIEW
jgi:hypothetical protein